jgi:2-polyprenyl-6-hydroxyphenyl methylase/3-demethylubiquinone-9 3-methyltransferase
MRGYYSDRLSADRLRRCYEIAPPAVKAYLEAEIDHVISTLSPGDRVLELGCGYGRVLARLGPHARSLFGIDTSLASLLAAREYLGAASSYRLAGMDATRLGFRDGVFDVVLCIQNGISAFAADKGDLFREAVRVARPGGLVLFSSYAERFWPQRLEWFEAQAAEGLIGPIDRERTRDGVIVCRDGFRATTVGPEEFKELAHSVELQAGVMEVGGSSLFCELKVGGQ